MQAAGRPYPGVRAKVIDGDGRELPPGAVGEVCLHTPARMVEYWGLPDRTAETLVDDWIHTGDAGYLDEDGYVFIRDRIKDAILVAGENVYPAEIENALESHPGVAEAVVVGAPDERWGEYVHAFVVADPGQPPSPRDLHTHLVPRLASFKLPARYEFIDSVPRNPSGKILRRACATASGATPPARSTDPPLPGERPTCPLPSPWTASAPTSRSTCTWSPMKWTSTTTPSTPGSTPCASPP